MTTTTRGAGGRFTGIQESPAPDPVPASDPAPAPEPTAGDAPDAGRLAELKAEAEAPKAPAPAPPAPGRGGARRGAGRPPGSRTKTAPAQAVAPRMQLDRGLVRKIIQAPYMLIAKRWGDHWILGDEEAESMVDPHMALAEKYLPAAFKENPALYMVIFMHTMSVLARADAHVRIVAEARRAKQAGGPRAVPAPIAPAPAPPAPRPSPDVDSPAPAGPAPLSVEQGGPPLTDFLGVRVKKDPEVPVPA